MNHIRTTTTVALLIAGLIGTAAAPASATSVIGFGNAAYGNSCTNQGSATAQGATTGGPGAATGLAVAIPGSNPTNQCGNLGIPDSGTIDAAALVVNTADLIDVKVARAAPQ